MIRWSVYLGAGLVAAVCVSLVLPPRIATPRADDGRTTPVRELQRRLVREVNVAADRLRDLRTVDSLGAVLREARPEGGIFIGAPDGYPIVDSAGSSAADLPAGAPVSPTPRIGVFGVPATQYHEGAPPTGLRRTAAFGRLDGRAVCIRIIPLPDRHGPLHLRQFGALDDMSILGTCAWVARHGVPGDGVARWLGAVFAAPALAAEDVRTYYDPRDPRLLTPATRMPADRCRTGDPDACREALLEGGYGQGRLDRWEAADGEAGGGILRERPWGLQVNGPLDLDLLADLEREFGPEAFARFWRSPDAVPEAFAAAFGRDPGEWYLDRTRSVWGPVRAGPAPTGTSLIAALVLCFLALWASSAIAGRRSATR